LAKYHESLAIYESLGRTADTADALTNLAAAHRLHNQFEKALDLAPEYGLAMDALEHLKKQIN